MRENLQRAPRVNIGFRVTPGTKADLEQAAKATGRSFSAEMEHRLEQSLSRDDVLGGPHVRHLTLALAATMAIAGQRLADEKKVKGNWTRDADCYLAAACRALDTLLREMPEGLPPKLVYGALEGVLLTHFPEARGVKK